MNPFKWAKQQVQKFLGGVEKGIAPAPRAKLDMRGMTKKVAGPRIARWPRPLPLGAKWFWISVKHVWEKNKDGIKELVKYSKTYNVGRNKAKRERRATAKATRAKWVQQRASFRKAGADFGPAIKSILDDPHAA